MDLGLKGKIALITGAGGQRGFGKTIALTLAAEGCDVIINDINLDDARNTAAQIEALGRKAIALKADVASYAEVTDMVNAALAEFGRIDILVNNAGLATQSKHFIDVTEAEWDKNINVDLKGVFNCSKAVLPQMLERRNGKIVSISSGAGKTGMPTSVPYSAAKAGVIGFTKALAADVAAQGINVNGVAPGPAETEFLTHAMTPPEVKERLRESIPLGRLTTTIDVASMVAFLASDVSSDIVGQTISVDGGLVMQ
jgi:3-oxoacyl-[acyl-carrier protein] reductase